jgi:hypothetical protein
MKIKRFKESNFDDRIKDLGYIEDIFTQLEDDYGIDLECIYFVTEEKYNVNTQYDGYDSSGNLKYSSIWIVSQYHEIVAVMEVGFGDIQREFRDGSLSTNPKYSEEWSQSKMNNLYKDISKYTDQIKKSIDFRETHTTNINSINFYY